MILRLELHRQQAEALRLWIGEQISELLGAEEDEMDLALFTALKKLRGQLGGKNESVEGAGRSLRSARRLP